MRTRPSFMVVLLAAVIAGLCCGCGGGGSAGAVDGGAGGGDAAAPPEPPPPDVVEPALLTWAESRLGFLDGTLSTEDALAADRVYRTAASVADDGISHLYGIRWVVMTALPSQTYLADNLRVMNQMYNPAGVAWETHEVNDISAAALVSPTGDNGEGGPYTLGALAGDIAAHLEMSGSPSPQDAVLELRSRLRDQGVADDEADALNTATSVRPKGFLQLIARTRPRLVHVFVVPTGGNAGTRDFFAIDAAATNIAILRAEPFDETPIVLAHEVGHFFGLKHSHGKTDPRTHDELAFDATRIIDRWGATGAFDVLAAQGFGPNLDAPLASVDSFLDYDAPAAELSAFTTFVEALIDVYVLPDHLYEKGPAGELIPVGAASGRLFDFRDRIASGSAMYWKVFGKKFPDQSRITNCNHDPLDLDLPVVCSYGAVARSGDDPFLADTVLLDGGTRSDLMSYVVPMDALGNPVWSAADPEKAFSPVQIQLIRIYANAPWMGGYANYTLMR